MGQLRIQLLGGFLLEWEGRSVSPIPSKAGRSLFAYLVTHRDRAPTRDLLAGMFWPDQPEPRARRRLSQALWQIQSVLAEIPTPEPYLVVTVSTVAFNQRAPYQLDVEELEEGLAGSSEATPEHRYGELEAAIRLYRGDFLAGYYDDWVLAEQRRLRDAYLAGLEELLQLAKSRARFDDALSLAHRLALFDPLREEAHQEVMRLAFLMGRTTEAIQQYERLRSILEEELGVEPSPVAEQLYREIVSRTERGTRPFTPASNSPLFEGAQVPFVGRDIERSTLLARMEEVMAGHGGLVLLEGESGVGKTRLLTQLADDAHWRGLGVLWGRCRSTGDPFEVIHSAIGNELSPLRVRQLAQRVDGVWLREGSQLLPAITAALGDLPERVSLMPGEERARTREALARILLGLGEINPYLVVIEDLHWSDLDSLSLIESLAGRLLHSGLLLVLSFRGDDARSRSRVWDTLRAVDASSSAHRIVLTPLSEAETVELVRRSLGLATVADEAARLLYKDTGGNPLFALETLRALHDLETTDAAAYLAGQGPLPIREEFPIPGTVQQVVAARLQNLPASTSEVLDAAAVYGDRLSLEVLAATGGLHNVDLLDTVDTLIRRGLLREADGHLEFSHGQIRRVAYGRVPGATARRLHREIGEALERTDLGSQAERAHHFELGQSWTKAAGYHREAGRSAMSVHAYETAASQYASAVGLIDRADLGEWFEVLAEFDDVLDVLGDQEEHARILGMLEQLVGAATERRIDVQLRRARAAGARGDLEAATGLSRSALEEAEAGAWAGETARALVSLGTYLVWSGNATEAVTHLERAVRLPDRVPRVEARNRLATALIDLQRYEEAKRILEEGLEDAAGDLRQRTTVLGSLAIVAAETGQSAEAEAAYGEALSLSRQIGYRRGEGVNLVNLANLMYFQGRTGEALQQYEQAAETFEQLGERRGEAMVLANSASVRINVLGDYERGVEDAVRARSYFEEAGDRVREAQCLEILALADRSLGNLDTARSLSDDGLRLATESANQWMVVQLERAKARILLDGGEPTAALQLAEKAASTCAELGMTELEPGLWSLAAEALLVLGEFEGARAASSRAVAGLHPGVERPYLVWLTEFLVLEAEGAGFAAQRALQRAVRELEKALGGLDSQQQSHARTAIAEHRRIFDAWDRLGPRTVRRHLARIGAPTGRRIRPSDLVEVEWTIVAPPEGGWRADPDARRELLVSLVDRASEQHGSPTIGDLAAVLEVSTATVRRDLGRLAESGIRPMTRGRRR